MLPRKNRIARGADFEAICRSRTAFWGDGLVLKIRENGLELARLGVSAGIRFSPKAVTRNRVKRQTRAFFWQNYGRIAKGWDMVVIIGKGFDARSNPSAELERIMVKNGLIKRLSSATRQGAVQK